MSIRTPAFTRPLPAEAAVKPAATGRIASLLAKVTDLVKADRITKASSYADLVAELVACEQDPKSKLPDAATIQAIVDAAGKSLGELSEAVAAEVKISRLVDALAGERQAIADRDEVKRKAESHRIKFEETYAMLQSIGDQISAELRDAEENCRNFAAKRRELESLAGGPSPEEIDILARIKALTDEEMRIRSRAGNGLLAERYVTGSFEESDQYREHVAIVAAIEECQDEIKAGDGNGMTRADFRLRKLLAQKANVERTLVRDRQLFALGGQVRKIREQQAELARKRDQFRKDRQALLTA